MKKFSIKAQSCIFRLVSLRAKHTKGTLSSGVLRSLLLTYNVPNQLILNLINKLYFTSGKCRIYMMISRLDEPRNASSHLWLDQSWPRTVRWRTEPYQLYITLMCLPFAFPCTRSREHLLSQLSGCLDRGLG